MLDVLAPLKGLMKVPHLLIEADGKAHFKIFLILILGVGYHVIIVRLLRIILDVLRGPPGGWAACFRQPRVSPAHALGRPAYASQGIWRPRQARGHSTGMPDDEPDDELAVILRGRDRAGAPRWPTKRRARSGNQKHSGPVLMVALWTVAL